MASARSRALYGTPVSKGIGLGRAFVKAPPEAAGGDVFEVMDLMARELEEAEAPEDLKGFLAAEAALLRDPDLRAKISARLKRGQGEAEAVRGALGELAEALERAPSEYMRQRASEIRALAEEIVSRLGGLGLPEEGQVYVSGDVSVAEALKLVKRGVEGVVLERGGLTSHGVIILRDFKVPTVIGVEGATRLITTGEELVVDGIAGKVLVEPEPEERARYEAVREDLRREEEALEALRGAEPVTLNGQRVELLVNLDLPEEMEVVKGLGAGVGLFRTEYLFLTGQTSLEAQERVYRSLAEAVAPKPFTLRAFDLGGDKVLGLKEDNPFLGLRGIRLLLAEPQLFETQLRAAVRANPGNLRLMFPMVSDPQEVLEAKELLERVAKEEGREPPPVGIMVEVPSAVLMAPELRGLVQFMSVGTNDLTQYLLAVDRQNYRVSRLYDALHPAVLRAVAYLVERAEGVEVEVCGELASDPLGAVALLALGVRALSVAPPSFLPIKKLIVDLEYGRLRELRERLLGAGSPEEVRRVLEAALPR